METLNYDIMGLIGKEVQVVRETAQNKATFGKVMDDINTLRPLMVQFTEEHYYWEGDMDSDYNENEQFLYALTFSSQCEDIVKLPFVRILDTVCPKRY